MMSMPACVCLRMTSTMPPCTWGSRAFKSATRPPMTSLDNCINSGGPSRRPACVVRMRSVLRFMGSPSWFRGDEYFAAPRVGNGSRLESGISKQAQPRISRENAEHMRVVNDTDRSVIFAQQIRKVDCVSDVAGIGIECPFDITNGPAVAGSAVVAAMRGEGNKCFASDVRHKQHSAARLPMHIRRFD